MKSQEAEILSEIDRYIYMSISVDVGLRTAVHFVREQPVHVPKIITLYDTDRGRGLARTIKENINHPALNIVRNLVCRVQLNNLLIVEKNGDGSPVMAGIVTGDLSKTESLLEAGVVAGDQFIGFDPKADFDWEDEELLSRVMEHEMWHVFLDGAFPKFGAYSLSAQGKTQDYFFPHFLNPFSHFFLRVAASEAGSNDFLLWDLMYEFNGRKPYIQAAQGEIHHFGLAATLYSGLLFSHVFPLEMFPETSRVAPLFKDKVVQLFDGILDEDGRRVTEAFSRELFSGSRMDNGDVDPNWYRGKLIKMWNRFLKEHG
jgi:hypothetical protein